MRPLAWESALAAMVFVERKFGRIKRERGLTMAAILSDEASQELAEQVWQKVEELAKSIVLKPRGVQDKPTISGYLNQGKAQKYVGSKALLEKLEQNGLGRYVIDGTIRYKVADIDEAMDLFRE